MTLIQPFGDTTMENEKYPLIWGNLNISQRPSWWHMLSSGLPGSALAQSGFHAHFHTLPLTLQHPPSTTMQAQPPAAHQGELFTND